MRPFDPQPVGGLECDDRVAEGREPASPLIALEPGALNRSHLSLRTPVR